jgi:Cu-Zn family superoxide dismutase
MNIEAVCVFQESKIKGYILFNEDKVRKQTKITLNLKNIPHGKHGFHIHTSGDLREGCKSLCDHFNPYNKTHGGPNDIIRHIGDLGNIEPNSKGIVKKVIYDNKIKLSGKNSIIGRSVIIHSGEDDLGRGGNPASLITGNAGTRIACGIIGYSKNIC